MLHRSTFARPSFMLFLLALALFLLVQGVWIGRNETIPGNDAGAHLVRAVETLDALHPLNRATLKAIWEVSEHRPPFSYVFTLPFFGLFGRIYDAALWSNTIWLALTALVVYVFARTTTDEWVALAAAVLTLLTPLLFQLTRLYYQETLVTLLLWLAFLSLLHSNDFAARRASLLFGMLVGLGLLVKWTVPALLAGALLWLLWRYRAEWRAHPPFDHRIAGIALAGSAALTALTVWLLAPALEGSPWQLFALLWSALYFLALYYGLLPAATRLSNLILAGVAAATVASWWYFPELQFAELFTDLVFGDAGRPDEMGGFSLLSYLQPDTWLFYLNAFAFEQGGIFWLLALLVALLLFLRRGQSHPQSVTLAGASLLVAWLIFTLSPFRDHARSMTPLLPAAALLTAYGLRALPEQWRTVGAGALALLLAWQSFQFLALSLPQGEAPARTLQSAGLLVRGTYQYYPDSGASDSAYHVAPAVLEILRQHPDEDGRVSLAMLINETQLHQNTLRAEFELLAPGYARVIPLTKETVTPYADLFNAPFVLYKTGVSNDLSPAAARALQRILNEPDGLFAAAYEPVWTHLLPNGEQIILAQRRHALVPASVRSTYELLASTLQPLLSESDALLVDNPAQVNALGAVGIATSQVVTAVEPLRPAQRLFAVLWQPDPATEPLLNETLVRSEEWWFEVHVIAYVAPGGALTTIAAPGALGGETLAALRYSADALTPGGGMVVELDWVRAPDTAGSGALRTVLELYNADGVLLAKRDLPPRPAL